jgi:carboxylesterase
MQKPIPIFEHPDLDGKTFFLNGNWIGILLIHGFTATTVEMRWLGEYFSKKGLTVSAPLLPGHGTSPKDLNNRKYTEWIKCAEDAFAELKKTCSSVIVSGESMGQMFLHLVEIILRLKLLFFLPAIKIASLNIQNIPHERSFEKDYDKEGPGRDIPFILYSLQVNYFNYRNISTSTRFSSHVVFHGAYDRTIDPDSDLIYVRSVPLSKQTHHGEFMSFFFDKEFPKAAELSWKFIKNLKSFDSCKGYNL